MTDLLDRPSTNDFVHEDAQHEREAPDGGETDPFIKGMRYAVRRATKAVGGQTKLAGIVGCSQAQISQLCQSAKSITPEHAVAIVQATVSAAEPVRIEELMPPALVDLISKSQASAIGTMVEQRLKPQKTKEEDPEAEIRWTATDPCLLFNLQPATRVYCNPFGQVVICQEARDYGDDDPFVFFQVENINRLIEALKKAAKDD